MNCPLWKKLLLLAAAALAAASSACGVAASSNTLQVIGVWTEGEEAAFNLVKQRFEAKTGIEVRYQGTRAVEQVLAADVQQGAAPDIAVLSSPGLLADYARRQEIKPLDFLEQKAESFYGRQWVDLQRLGTGKLYSVAVKADLKSAIWYRPATLPGPKPATWQQLVNLATSHNTPWCLGLAAPPTSGWPGTDWIEDILLHSAGPEIYRQWAAGTLPWTSDPVRKAFQDWGAVAVRPGGIQGGAPPPCSPISATRPAPSSPTRQAAGWNTRARSRWAATKPCTCTTKPVRARNQEPTTTSSRSPAPAHQKYPQTWPRCSPTPRRPASSWISWSPRKPSKSGQATPTQRPSPQAQRWRRTSTATQYDAK